MKFALMCLLVWCGASAAHAQSNLKSEIGIDQYPGDQVPLDVQFRNEDGETIALGSLFDGRPVLLMPVYYRCPMLCGLELDGMVRCLRAMTMEPGNEFRIVTFSIDPTEQPELAAGKKSNLLKQLGRPDYARGWSFLTADQSSIDAVCQAVGFRARHDAKTGQYAHAAGTMILTPEGKISRYLLGVDFSPRDVRLALVEASQNEIGTITDQVLLYCYQYDASTGKYTLAIMNLVRGGGVVTVLMIVGGIGILLWRERTRPATRNHPAL